MSGTATAMTDPVYARALRLALRDPRVLAIDEEARTIASTCVGVRWARRIKQLQMERSGIIEAAIADPDSAVPRIVAGTAVPTAAPTA